MSPPTGAPLRCPGCGESMIEVDSDAVLIDVCSGCNALWLDKGELEQLGGRLPSHSSAGAPPKRPCPRCHVPMDQRDAHLVMVDICWGCGGLFVDSEGFARLVEASGGRKPAPDDDATPAAGIPAVALAAVAAPAVAAASAPGQPPPKAPPAGAEPRPDQQLFWCEFCRQPSPVSVQVVGERANACPDCAQRHGIKHDPRARRKAEARQTELNRHEHVLEPASVISSAIRYLLGK